jgi:hypothetical protein
MSNVPSIQKRINKDKENLIECLRKTPIVQIACEKSGIGRATFYRWCQEDGTFAEQARNSLNEGKSLINDMAESQLISSIKEKNFQAIAYWLKHNHPAYTTRVEITQPGSKQINQLSAEQEAVVKKALELASLSIESGGEDGKTAKQSDTTTSQ